ncbi:MAG: DsbA family protein [Anaerolineales bacterium]
MLCCGRAPAKIAPEYEGRVRLVERAFPLEIYGGGPPDRKELELEIWLAALQESAATFKPFSDDFPTTTLPAFDAAWCAFQQGRSIGRDFDLRIRRAFFAEGRNIGKREVMFDLAREAKLDLDDFTRRFNSDEHSRRRVGRRRDSAKENLVCAARRRSC